ncbi:Crp/Fnr family transcriptional regulator [Pedobacter ginsenosidimutans]|uniref:Crp/Fnr family transcriptional regulator n=1 Tax=Pedobacter ginsenosidimutans TaxID=687842 RepID=A0A0T5VKF8_9SPHI|nr:Crp/Fnr family transcriptional regulator [Pedobacter ginsenosidimutans]
MDNSKKILRDHIEKVVKLTDNEFDFVIGHFALQSFKRTQFIIQAGDHVKDVFFILSGLVKLFYMDESAKQHIVSFAMEDWWETDFNAYYAQRRAVFSLACLENTETYSLSLENFNRLCSGLQKMEHFFLMKSIAGHIGSQERILSFLTSDARARYENLINKSPSLLQRVPKATLALYLGVSRETLSRLGS